MRLWIGPAHKVSSLIAMCNKTLSAADSFEGTCEIKGMTSTWALADGGLVFCEDDAIFELDGWEEADKATIQFVAETDNSGIDQWTQEGAVPPPGTIGDFTLLEVNDIHWDKGL